MLGAAPGPVMNGPADGEVDYKKKYRNLKRKLKFLIYVSAGEEVGVRLPPGGPRLSREEREWGALSPGSASRPRRLSAPLTVMQEHECFQEELRKAQRKLLKVSRDKR